MDNLPSQKQLQDLILLTAENLQLKQPYVVEKDFYITQLLKILCGIDDDNFQLVFAGGTSLSKAHRLVRRMSEDVDFKIKKLSVTSSKSQTLKELKRFRDRIIAVIKDHTNFSVIDTAVRNEGHYMIIKLSYPSVFPASEILRSHILLEFTAAEIRLPTNELMVQTLIEETLGNEINLPNANLTCLALEETLAEKWVGLTRRVGAIERGYYADDHTLVRHVYDLAIIQSKQKSSDKLCSLIHNIISQDAKQFKTQYIEYFSKPKEEIIFALDLLSNSEEWRSRYSQFIETMVYDKSSPLAYQQAVVCIKKIGEEVLAGL